MADYVRSEQKTLLPFLGSSTKNHTSQSLCECLKTQKLSRIMRFFWFLGVETFLGLVNFLPNPVSSTNFHRRSLLDQLGNKAQKCLERERNPFVNAASFMDETEGSSKQDRSVQSGVNHQKYVEAQITTQNLKNQEIRPGRKAKDKGNPSISSDNHQPFSKVKGSPNAQKASPKESVSSVTDKAFPQEKDLPGGTQHQAYVHLRSSENHAHEFSTQSHLAPPYYPEHQSSSTEYYGLNAASDINPAVVPEGYALRETIQPALYPGYFQTKAPVVTWQDVWQFAYQPVNIVQHELVPLPPNFQFRSGSSYPVAQGKEQTVTTSPKSNSRSNELTPQEKLRPLPKSGANSVISSKQSPGPLSSIGPERLNHDIPEPVHESSANALAKSDSFRNTSLKNPLVTEKTPPKDPLGIGVSQGIRKAAHIFQNPEFGSNGDGLRKKWAQVVKGGEFVPPSKTETDSGASMKSSTEPLIGNKLRISPLQVDTESMSNLVPDENASKSAAGSTSASKTNLENKGVTGTRIDQEMSEKSDNSSLKMTTQGASSTKKNIEEKSLPEGKKPVPSGSYSISRSPQESSGNQMPKAQVESFPSFKSPESDLNTISTKSER
ncbi:hypothetical protein O181_020991, partial [Austropuccinia psidii MF-1]|nr:hypothetical protein [Austropuccinia psidii MF-1]